MNCFVMKSGSAILLSMAVCLGPALLSVAPAFGADLGVGLSSGRWNLAQVDVKAPKELLLGKVQHAEVTVSLERPAHVLEIRAHSEGAGIGLPLVRKWRFVQVKAGKPSEFKVPYQLTKKFQSGKIHFEIRLQEAPTGRLEAFQSATLRLSR